MFPFVLPCFAPTAVPQVLPFRISPPGSALDFHFLSSASVLASHYSAFCSSFPHSSRFCLTAGFLGASFLLTLSGSLPFFPTWFPVSSFRFCVLGFLFVSFRPSSSFTPTAVPLALAIPSVFRLLLRRFPLLPLSFVCFRLGSDYSASVSSFLFFPFLPHSGLSGALRFLSSPSISPSVPPVSMHSFRICYSAFLRFLSPLTVSHHRCYFSRRPPVSSSAVPLSFRLRFRLFGRVIHPEN